MAPTDALFQLLYVSTTREDLSKEALVQLLEKSRSRNHALGITGMLLYQDHSVVQILEGTEADVIFLFQRISSDPRHHGIRILYEGEVKERDFSEWTMGFADLDDDELRSKEGYSEYLNLPLGELPIEKTRMILARFKTSGGWLPALSLPAAD
jgi:hypothetical protein